MRDSYNLTGPVLLTGFQTLVALAYSLISWVGTKRADRSTREHMMDD